MLDLVEDKKPNDFSGEKIMRKNQYRVIVKWIYDLEKHKEFMSEEDYEVDEKGDLKVHKVHFNVHEDIGCRCDICHAFFQLDMTYDAFASACKRKAKKRAPSAPITDVKSKRTVQEWQVVIQQETQKVARDKDAQIQLLEARIRDKDDLIKAKDDLIKAKEAHATREHDTRASYTSSLQKIVNSFKSNSRSLSVNSNLLTEALQESIHLPADNDNRHQELQHHGSMQLQVLMMFIRQLRVRRRSKKI